LAVYAVYCSGSYPGDFLAGYCFMASESDIWS